MKNLITKSQIKISVHLFVIIIFTLIGTSVIMSCKKDKNQPVVEDPITPPITATSTTLNITSKQYCDYKNIVLPECLIEFSTSQVKLDSNIIAFKLTTDVNGKYTLIGKEVGVYYYKAIGTMMCNSNSYKIINGKCTILKGAESTLNVNM